MKPLTEASTEYLRPEENLGSAILRLTLPKSASAENKPDHFVLEIFDEEDEEIIDEATGEKRMQKNCISPFSWNATSFVERRFKHGFTRLSRKGIYHPIYSVPITDYTIELVQNAWTGTRVVSPAAKPYFTNIFLREFNAEQNAKRTAEFKQNGKVPSKEWFDNHDEWLVARGNELTNEPFVMSPYQKTAAFNACHTHGYGFFCDPGTGKTLMMIRKLDYVIDHSKRETITLVLCPKSVRTNWINELRKFSRNWKKIHIITLQGNNPTDRAINVINEISSEEAAGKHILIISGYESFVQTPKIHVLEYDLCLLDESHNIANPSTKRTKTLGSLRANFANVVIATGTPFRNSPFDGFSQLEFLGEGYSGFDSFNAFKRFYGEFSEGYNGHTQLEGFRNIPLLQEKLAKHAFIIRKEEALPYLPKKTYSIAECNLSRDQLKVYMQLVQQLAAEIESYGPDPDSITVNNILTQMLRLAQITSGFAATDNGLINRFDPNPKLELLVHLLTGKSQHSRDSGDDDEGSDREPILRDKNRKAIVWCAFKENLKMISARLNLEGIDNVMFHGSSEDKPGIIDKFNNDRNCRVFIGIAASGGVGLNLVGFDALKASSYSTNTTDIIYYSSNWSSVNRLQAADRAHRHNTRVPVHITDLLIPSTIDFEIYERVNMKAQMSLSLQDVRKILASLIPR